MSLKEALLGLIDNVNLPAIFSRKTENLQELRRPLLKGISNAKRQFESRQTRAPHRWWKLSNDVVALTVKIKGDVFTINGVETNHIPSDRFSDFLDKFASAVGDGDFDDELRHKGAGDAAVKIPKAKRAVAKPAQTAKPIAATAPDATEKSAVPAPAEPALAPKPKSPAAQASKAVGQKAKRNAVHTRDAPSEKLVAAAVPATAEASADPALAKAKAAPKPKSSPVKAVRAASPKPKRKPIDAKTAYARAEKAAATRAANKARKAVSAATTDET